MSSPNIKAFLVRNHCLLVWEEGTTCACQLKGASFSLLLHGFWEWTTQVHFTTELFQQPLIYFGYLFNNLMRKKKHKTTTKKPHVKEC